MSTRPLCALTRWSSAGISAGMIACGGGGNGTPPDGGVSCDQACMDGTALRALREAIKLVYNKTLQGGPVGAQDQTTLCPLGGRAHIFGQATSNAEVGTTSVDLTYVFMQCEYSETQSDPSQTFQVTVTGTLTESGTIAAQPSTTTSLQFQSDALTLSGSVEYPPIPYDANACVIVLGQIGGDLSGMLCGRMAGVTL